jgi:hypothetical protein
MARVGEVTVDEVFRWNQENVKRGKGAERGGSVLPQANCYSDGLARGGFKRPDPPPN